MIDPPHVVAAPEPMPGAIPEPMPGDAGQALVDAIVAQGPSGAFAVAGIATAVVVLLYFAFYVFAYLPRGAMQ